MDHQRASCRCPCSTPSQLGSSSGDADNSRPHQPMFLTGLSTRRCQNLSSSPSSSLHSHDGPASNTCSTFSEANPFDGASPSYPETRTRVRPQRSFLGRPAFVFGTRRLTSRRHSSWSSTFDDVRVTVALDSSATNNVVQSRTVEPEVQDLDDHEPCPPEFIQFAERLAEASGEVIRRYFRTPVQVDDKLDSSPVTIADRQAELAIRELIECTYPSHGILGEEHESERLDSEWVWVLDPIDGTKSFITGRAEFGTLIALLHNKRPVLGIIDQPISRERWVGANGAGGTTLNGKKVRVRECGSIDKAILYTTSPHFFSAEEFVAFEKVRHAVKVPLYGCDCYQYAMLASGFVDLVVEAGLKPYDYCALEPVIRNAGGLFTDWTGGPISLTSQGRVVAAASLEVHSAAIHLLKSIGTVPANPSTPRQSEHVVESMTGYGQGLAVVDGVTGKAEVRCVNARFCDMTVHLPRGMERYEIHLRNILKKRLVRGTISVFATAEDPDSAMLASMQVSPSLLKGYRRLLDEVRLGSRVMGDDVKLDHVLKIMELFPPPADASAAVFSTAPQEASIKKRWAAIIAAVDQAISRVVQMRREEGSAIRKDLLGQLVVLEGALAEIEKRAPQRIPEAKKMMQDRLAQLLAEEQHLDEGRLEQEIAQLASRLDVTEECVRLHSHVQQFETVILDPTQESLGNKLNFLTQEMNRETNTIGSKANDASIIQHVIVMKEHIEQIRQQIQNLK